MATTTSYTQSQITSTTILFEEKTSPVGVMDDNYNYTEYRACALEGRYNSFYVKNGIHYYGDFYIQNGGAPYCFDNKCDEFLKKYYTSDSPDSLLVQSIPENSKVFLGPNINVPVEDLRKHYKIKRNMQDAEYLVTNFTSQTSGIYLYSYVCVWHKMKFFLFMETGELRSLMPGAKVEDIKSIPSTVLDIINKELGTSLGQPDEIRLADGFHRFQGKKAERVFMRNILEQKILIPSIPLNKCVLGCNIPLTLDTVKTFATVCRQPIRDDDGPILKAIAAISQTNWRQYLGSLSRVWKDVYYKGKLQYMTVSSLPIGCKAFFSTMNCCWHNYQSEEDYNMYKEYLKERTNIKDVSFITRREKEDLANSFWNSEDFYNHYSICIKIRPRTYQEYLAATTPTRYDE